MKIYGLNIEDTIKFGGIKISGKEPQEPDINWKEIQGYDEEATDKAISDTIERLKNN